MLLVSTPKKKKKLLWSIISQLPPLVLAARREGRWDQEAHNIWSFPGSSKPVNHFHKLNQYQVSPGDRWGQFNGFSNTLQALIFPHIKREEAGKEMEEHAKAQGPGRSVQETTGLTSALPSPWFPSLSPPLPAMPTSLTAFPGSEFRRTPLSTHVQQPLWTDPAFTNRNRTVPQLSLF